MFGVNTDSFNSNNFGSTLGVPVNSGRFGSHVKSGEVASFSQNGASTSDYFTRFSNQAKDVFGAQNSGMGSYGSVMEFSISASIKQTFEGYYSYSGQNSNVSAYIQQTEQVNVQMSFRAQQANNVAQAHIDAMAAPFGPEATASRIVDFALSFFPMFAKQHPEMSYEEQVDAYQKLIGAAIDDGFSEAMKILGALPDSVMEQVNETRSLIDEKLGAFFEHLKGDGADEGKKAMENGVWRDFVNEFFEPSNESK